MSNALKNIQEVTYLEQLVMTWLTSTCWDVSQWCKNINICSNLVLYITLAICGVDIILRSDQYISKRGSLHIALQQQANDCLHFWYTNRHPWPIRRVIPGGAGATAPPTFGEQHFFRDFHTPLTERYHQKWC